MKIVSFLLSNLGRLHHIDAKITAFYDVWRAIFDKVAPLLPQHVAATAAATAAAEEALTAAVQEAEADLAKPSE